jgi:ABC-type antimicrobial peptide transport system permease subunit
LVKELKLSQPIGAQLTLDSQQVTIVGVVQDYKEFGNHGHIPAMAFKPVKAEAYRYLILKARPEDLKEVRAFLETEWHSLLPNVPFQPFYQEEVTEKEIRMNNGLKLVCFSLAFLIMLLSAVGLYGLVSLNILKRLKEIGMRKVLGASVTQIIFSINREFTNIILLSFAIGTLLGYLLVSKLVFTVIYAYHAPIGVWPFMATLVIIAGGAGLTIGYKVYWVASLNPSTILKND